jgi:hypothetical protein
LLAPLAAGRTRYVDAMRLRRTCLLPCAVEWLAGALARPVLFHHLASPLLVFDAVEPADGMERWSPGKHRFRLLIGGRVPIGEHVVNLQRTVADPTELNANPVVWHDAGYSDLIRMWDHKIELEDFFGMTRYTDDVEIHAGPLTLPAWLFAYVFYSHRQRRLNRLVAADFAY